MRTLGDTRLPNIGWARSVSPSDISSQGSALQATLWESSPPVHPPRRDTCRLSRTWRPPSPQVTEQGDHSDQGDHSHPEEEEEELLRP